MRAHLLNTTSIRGYQLAPLVATQAALYLNPTIRVSRQKQLTERSVILTFQEAFLLGRPRRSGGITVYLKDTRELKGSYGCHSSLPPSRQRNVYCYHGYGLISIPLTAGEFIVELFSVVTKDIAPTYVFQSADGKDELTLNCKRLTFS